MKRKKKIIPKSGFCGGAETAFIFGSAEIFILIYFSARRT